VAEQTQTTLAELIDTRKKKLAKLIDLGVEPYGYEYDITHHAREIVDHFEEYEEDTTVSLAGRLLSIRGMGKASFAHMQDSTGKIQIYIKMNVVGEKPYEAFTLLDIGDWIGVTGKVMKTRTGEITVFTEAFAVLSKTLRPIPVVKEKEGEVYDAFADKEQRYRQRYLDLIVNPGVKDVFVQRSKIIRTIRDFLDGRGFVEVETPVLQPIYGGASARPFITHHNTLDTDFYLRIADELYLKRLIVGGFEKVYEIAKNFRNEGMDRNHNPEFTMLEWYQAFVDYEYEMDMVEELVGTVAAEVGASRVEFEGAVIELSSPFRRKTFFGLLEEALGEDVSGYDKEGLRELIEQRDLPVARDLAYGQMLDKLFGEVVEPELIQPTFVTDFPLAISPLAKKKRGSDGSLVERFELFVAGMELANSFSELNDPIDQRERFEEQGRLRAEGDEEAQVLDEDFLEAIEVGMPPTGGVGIGIDRLVMLLTGERSIKDVLLFPQMRPRQ